MVQSKAKTVKEYLSDLPADRRAAIEAVRGTILRNLPEGYEECMQYGMISYVVPLKLYSAGYLGDKKTPLPFAGLASQKNHMAVYLMTVYCNKDLEKWFTSAYKKAGRRLDMGKSCVRFKKLEDLPLEVIGEVVSKVTVKAFIAVCEKAWEKRRR
ncbi:MAG: DUF1801 domain-containing protein [bacterium]